MPDYLSVFNTYRKSLAGALRQISDEEFFQSPGGSANSAAIIVQHLAGNFRSRFTDFLTSDGEKPWRNREAEFQASSANRQDIMDDFEDAWEIMADTVRSLNDSDFRRTITIKGEEWSVADALLRSVAHFANHVGQVILIGKLVLERRQEAPEESESASFRCLHELVGIPVDAMRGRVR